MSRFAKSMKNGKRVRQANHRLRGCDRHGDRPHLDFRIRKQGQFVNPDKLIIPRDQALEKRRMADYKLVVHAVDAYLTGKDTASYDPDTWFKDED
ncbi:MAG: hypothetical protein ACLSHC_11710 [Bilophila wadsworthia]